MFFEPPYWGSPIQRSSWALETSILGSQIFKEPDIILEGSPENLEARLFEEFILWKAQPSVFGILGIATDKTWGSKYLG